MMKEILNNTAALTSPSIAFGVDVVKTASIAEAVARWGERFLQRCFTERERACCDGCVESLAALFAAKEAVFKALNAAPGSGIGWRELEIIAADSSSPNLILHGRALNAARSQGWSSPAVSLSHDGGIAAAMAVVIRKEEPDR